jgi:SAM-dependent methyltransferase
MISRYVDLRNAVALDIGCGIGKYMTRMSESGAHSLGLDVDWSSVVSAREAGHDVMAAVGERLPLRSDSVDAVLLNEVLEHVADDRHTMREVVRILRPGGHAVAFVPNRLWPFETHGVMFRGKYVFGNAPLVNYFPDGVRNRLAPHVRVYTRGTLKALVRGLPVQIVTLTQVYPGFDKLVARHPRAGEMARTILYALEDTPLAAFGLSHFLVIRKTGD